MKKVLLTIAALATCTFATNAQRLSLYEEFTGENCPPCASTNPGLWTLITASGNASKVIMIKYMVPIPSSGWFYLQDKANADTRSSYYNVPFAPYARMDGKVVANSCSSPGHPGCLTQSDINASSSVASNFIITATSAYDATYDTIISNIVVTATSAFAPSGANMKLRTALVQTYEFNSAPGTNGETEFENVVRAMYPSAAGTSVPNTWTAAMVQNYTIKGKIPTFVDKSKSPFLVVWLQNDNDSVVAQTTISVPLPKVPNDLGISGSAKKLYCVAGTSGSIAPSVTLTNSGTNTLTSATVFYKIDASGSWVSQPWTGSLAAGATTNVTFPSATVGVGAHTIYDSVYLVTDQNIGNNSSSSSINVASTAGITMPYYQNFEAANFPSGWYSVDVNGNGKHWVNGNGTGLAHNGSNYMPWYYLGSMAAGETNLLVMPTPTPAGGHATLDFFEAYAQQSASNNDELSIVYSSDCGTTWTNVWSKTGSAHATTSPTTTYWLPSPSVGTTDWQFRSVDLSSVPANSLVAFKAVANGGNNLFLDDMALTTKGVGVNTPASVVNKARIYPNPAKDAATLELTLGAASDLQVEITDAVGHVINTISNHYNAGEQNITINTSVMPAGLYNVKVITGANTTTHQLSVVK